MGPTAYHPREKQYDAPLKCQVTLSFNFPMAVLQPIEAGPSIGAGMTSLPSVSQVVI